MAQVKLDYEAPAHLKREFVFQTAGIQRTPQFLANPEMRPPYFLTISRLSPKEYGHRLVSRLGD